MEHANSPKIASPKDYSIPELCFVQFKVNTQYPFDSTDKMPHIVISMESYKVSIQ